MWSLASSMKQKVSMALPFNTKNQKKLATMQSARHSSNHPYKMQKARVFILNKAQSWGREGRCSSSTAVCLLSSPSDLLGKKFLPPAQPQVFPLHFSALAGVISSCAYAKFLSSVCSSLSLLFPRYFSISAGRLQNKHNKMSACRCWAVIDVGSWLASQDFSCFTVDELLLLYINCN